MRNIVVEVISVQFCRVVSQFLDKTVAKYSEPIKSNWFSFLHLDSRIYFSVTLSRKEVART